MKPSHSVENNTPSNTYWRVQLVSKNVQVHITLEPQLEYNQDQIPLTNQDSLWPFQPSSDLQKYYAVSDYF